LAGCQIVKPKNPNLGKFCRAKMLVNSMPIYNILRTFGIFYCHFGNLVAITNTITM
jgi:hypothetical protein